MLKYRMLTAYNQNSLSHNHIMYSFPQLSIHKHSMPPDKQTKKTKYICFLRKALKHRATTDNLECVRENFPCARRMAFFQSTRVRLTDTESKIAAMIARYFYCFTRFAHSTIICSGRGGSH